MKSLLLLLSLSIAGCAAPRQTPEEEALALQRMQAGLSGLYLLQQATPAPAAPVPAPRRPVHCHTQGAYTYCR